MIPLRRIAIVMPVGEFFLRAHLDRYLSLEITMRAENPERTLFSQDYQPRTRVVGHTERLQLVAGGHLSLGV